MYLQNVTFQNFRCFEKLEVTLHPRLTVLVAENGAGKTSILDGIAVGLSALLPYLSSANQRLSGIGFKDTDFRLLEEKKRTIPLRAPFTQIVMNSTSGLKWEKSKTSTKGYKIENKIGVKDLSQLGNSILQSYARQEPEVLPVFSYYGANRGHLPIPQRLRGTRNDYQQPTSALMGSLNANNDFKEMLNWFDLEESNELRANKGCHPEEYEPSVLLETVRTAIGHLLGRKFVNPRFNSQHKFVVDCQDGPSELQVSQLSQGYQSMLALGMDFAHRLGLANRHLLTSRQANLEKLSEPLIPLWKSENIEHDFSSNTLLAPSIMLVDEIDLHLHPSWQQRVIGDLMAAFPATQFIVTTHSPQILTTVKTENIRVLETDPVKGCSIQTPKHNPYGHSNSDALASIMDTNPIPTIDNLPNLTQRYEQLAKAGLMKSEEALAIHKQLELLGFEFTASDLALFQFLSSKAKKETQDD